MGLDGSYGNDGYVYYVDNYGNPLSWFGFNGTANNSSGSPYLSCPLHTQEYFQNYLPNQGFGDQYGDQFGGDYIYPDDFDYNYGGNYGGTTDNYYGDYSGNGDVWF